MEALTYILLAVLFWGVAPIFGKLGLKEATPPRRHHHQKPRHKPHTPDGHRPHRPVAGTQRDRRPLSRPGPGGGRLRRPPRPLRILLRPEGGRGHRDHPPREDRPHSHGDPQLRPAGREADPHTAGRHGPDNNRLSPDDTLTDALETSWAAPHRPSPAPPARMGLSTPLSGSSPPALTVLTVITQGLQVLGDDAALVQPEIPAVPDHGSLQPHQVIAVADNPPASAVVSRETLFSQDYPTRSRPAHAWLKKNGGIRRFNVISCGR